MEHVPATCQYTHCHHGEAAWPSDQVGGKYNPVKGYCTHPSVVDRQYMIDPRRVVHDHTAPPPAWCPYRLQQARVERVAVWLSECEREKWGVLISMFSTLDKDGNTVMCPDAIARITEHLNVDYADMSQRDLSLLHFRAEQLVKALGGTPHTEDQRAC